MGTPPGRIVLGTVAVALLACCGWFLLRVDTEYGPPLGPDRILDEVAGNAEPDAMRRHALRALRDRPIDGKAFRVLGSALAREGAADGAMVLNKIAVRRDPRDWQAHAFLMDAAFRRGDTGAAMLHLDAILRLAPSLAEPLLQAIMAELGDARLRRALVDLCMTEQPWAPRMLSALRDRSADPADAAAFLEALSLRRPLTPSERTTLIDVLSRAGRASEARAQWLAALEAGDRALVDTVFDGDFEEQTPILGEFAWSWDAGPGIDISLEKGDAASGQQSLRIDFSGRAVTLRAPSQRLALAPGPYVLSGAFDDRTNASRPFTLVVACAQGAELARLDLPFRTRSRWAHAETSLDVPGECTQQRLWLTFRSRSLGDAQVVGTLRLDDLKVRKTLQ